MWSIASATRRLGTLSSAAARSSTSARAAGGAAAAALAFAVAAQQQQTAECLSKPDGVTSLRKKSFDLDEHHHGKAKVRVLRVRPGGSSEGVQTVQEYTVATRLFSPAYSAVFTAEDNAGLVATDTQKNTVYVVAQKSTATTPEAFGVDMATHLLNEYPILTAVEVDVTEDLWKRHVTPEGPHEHGFIKHAPERSVARVRLARDAPDAPEVVSLVTGLTVLKTTQSGFDKYLHDQYTLLPDTQERCLATEMTLEWTYTTSKGVDYGAVRESVRAGMLHGFFGAPKGGLFSASLQATIYDAGCLVLASTPAVAAISIDTPNIHMIPFHALKALTGKPFADDVYVATSEPSGSIHCRIKR